MTKYKTNDNFASTTPLLGVHCMTKYKMVRMKGEDEYNFTTLHCKQKISGPLRNLICTETARQMLIHNLQQKRTFLKHDAGVVYRSCELLNCIRSAIHFFFSFLMFSSPAKKWQTEPRTRMVNCCVLNCPYQKSKR